MAMMRKLKLFILNLRDIFRIAAIIPDRDLFRFYFTFYPFNGNRLTSIRIRSLGNKKIWIRRSAIIDRDVIKYVFYNQYHLPLQDLSGKNAIILDLGCNIGLTLLHFRQLFPKAVLIGYETDLENYEIAQKNTASLVQCRIHNQAVWTEATNVNYAATGDEDAYHIDVKKLSAGSSKTKMVTAVAIRDILKENGLTWIDYLKMDIEGSESDIFLASELDWLSHVNELNIEIHGADGMEAIQKLLMKNGFYCQKDSKHPALLHALRNSI